MCEYYILCVFDFYRMKRIGATGWDEGRRIGFRNIVYIS